MRLAYADPPYLGLCKLYGHRHEDPWGPGMAPASELPPGVHAGCGRPVMIRGDEFRRWWFQPRSEPFVTLRQFTAAYCLCRREDN